MLVKLINLNIFKYLMISCIAGLIDLFISRYLFSTIQINYLLACNLGIAAGFLFQYLTGMKYVFKNHDAANPFAVYLATFTLGLLLASITMWISYEQLRLGFIGSKLLSMAIPFFITYFTRKVLLGVKLERKVKYENLL
jgi:putative flippase GtrA